MLGLRYAEWAHHAHLRSKRTSPPPPWALDDLGHSRVPIRLLEPLGSDPRGLNGESDPASLRSLPYFDDPWSEWAQFVAANAILDTAPFTAMIEPASTFGRGARRYRLRKDAHRRSATTSHGTQLAQIGINAEPLDRAWGEAIDGSGHRTARLPRCIAKASSEWAR